MPEKQTPKDALFEELSIIGLNATKQYRIGDVFVALAFPNQKAAIEVDDSSHLRPEIKSADEKRDVVLAAMGWRVLRLRSDYVNEDTTKAAMDVEHFVGNAPETNDDAEDIASPSNPAGVKVLVKAAEAIPARAQTGIQAAPAKNKTPVKVAQKPSKVAETKIRKPKVSAAKIKKSKKKARATLLKKRVLQKSAVRKKEKIRKTALHSEALCDNGSQLSLTGIILIGAAAVLAIWVVIAYLI